MATGTYSWWNCSNLGSPDAVWSTTATPEKLNYLPVSAIGGKPGSKLVMTYTPSTATTIDASKCVGNIPIIVNNQPQLIGLNGGGAGGLGNANFISVVALTDRAFAADVEATAFSIRASEGCYFKVGGGKVFVSLEDNA